MIRDSLPWFALGAALSAPLLNLARSLDAIPFPGSLAIAPLLALRLITLERNRSGDARPASDAGSPRASLLLGLLLLIFGISVQLIGILGDAWSIAWLSMPPAIVGMAILTRAFDPRLACLCFWFVPIPTTIFLASTPWAEVALARVAALPFRLFAVPIEIAGPLVRFRTHGLQVGSFENGLHVAWLLGLVLWYAMLRRNESLAWLIPRALTIAPLALALQIGSIQIAMLLLVTDAPVSGERWLALGGWITIAVAGVVWAERGARSPKRC